MKTFLFTATVSGTCHGYISADSLAEAKKKFKSADWDDVMDEETEVGELLTIEETDEDS